MFKKVKNTWNKVEPYALLIVTLILFLLISYIIFIYFKDAKLFNNNSLNLATLIIFFLAIYSFIINLYYKIFKFTLMKPSITKGEFYRLWKKRRKISQELKKGMENKTIPHNSKKFKEKWKAVEEIEEILDEKTISFKSWFVFFIFSIYFGMSMGHPFWAIKNSTKYFWKATEYFFSLKKIELGFKWYKLKDENYIINSFIYPYKKPKK